MHTLDEIRAYITGILADPEVNRLSPDDAEPAWGPPLLGVSDGDDLLYEEVKEDIGSFHWTPREIFVLSFPDLTVPPGGLSVIVWALPQTAATLKDQREATLLPSRRWAQNRRYGEEINDLLRRRLAAALTAAGHPAVAPVASPLWRRETSARRGEASTWSERHAAWVSGLGTFGLCDGLITEAGKAVRIGSVVAALSLLTTPRPYAGLHDWCLHDAGGVCHACIDRCPAGAITEAGHDKERCMAYIRSVAAPSCGGTNACGLCQAGVPCEHANPARTP
ncbi:4Fe-4S ferredoxin [Methanofollis tationis]|uniref:4Fe-4S ferredoxin n=1 Tax=Methanofollis tationis TaxID=81417 RepID=A0A7K4HR37_9EURY|nr:4Fe-4S ferredoxin [Methanofollis tationis]NVO67318.1 4Fe-4S ferredoxin [Methanofollis tationis]